METSEQDTKYTFGGGKYVLDVPPKERSSRHNRTAAAEEDPAEIQESREDEAPPISGRMPSKVGAPVAISRTSTRTTHLTNASTVASSVPSRKNESSRQLPDDDKLETITKKESEKPNQLVHEDIETTTTKSFAESYVEMLSKDSYDTSYCSDDADKCYFQEEEAGALIIVRSDSTRTMDLKMNESLLSPSAIVDLLFYNADAESRGRIGRREVHA